MARTVISGRTVIAAPDTTYLLQEDGFALLLESGDNLLTEATAVGGGGRTAISTTRGVISSRTVI